MTGALPFGEFGDCVLSPLPVNPMQLFGGGVLQLSRKCLYYPNGGCNRGEGGRCVLVL